MDNILRYLKILNYLNVKNSYHSICMSEKRNQNRNKFYCLRKNDARNFSVMWKLNIYLFDYSVYLMMNAWYSLCQDHVFGRKMFLYLRFAPNLSLVSKILIIQLTIILFELNFDLLLFIHGVKCISSNIGNQI